MLKELNPSGTADAMVHLRVEAGKNDAVVPVAVVVDLRNMRAKVNQFPYPLNDLTGSVEWVPDKVRLVGIRGRAGDAIVDIDGSVDIGKPDGKTSPAEVTAPV